jgi:hypothetical protein
LFDIVRDMILQRRIGLAAFIVGSLLCAWAFWLNRPIPEAVFRPVYEPISLGVGHIHQDFTTGLGVSYVMGIQVDRKLPFEELQCLMGLRGQSSGKDACHGIPAVLDYSWALGCNGRVIRTGSSGKLEGGAYTDETMEAIFGWLDGKRGQECYLDLDFHRDGSGLAKANPRLHVEVDNSYYEDRAFGFLTYFFGGLAIVIVGGVLMLLSFLRGRMSEKEKAT